MCLRGSRSFGHFGSPPTACFRVCRQPNDKSIRDLRAGSDAFFDDRQVSRFPVPPFMASVFGYIRVTWPRSFRRRRRHARLWHKAGVAPPPRSLKHRHRALRAGPPPKIDPPRVARSAGITLFFRPFMRLRPAPRVTILSPSRKSLWGRGAEQACYVFPGRQSPTAGSAHIRRRR